MEIGFLNFAVDNFFLQILFVSLFFCWSFEKRKYFALRLCIASAVCIAYFFLRPLHRDGIYTWVTEQALREIYLKPFKIAIRKGGANGIKTSYNRVGAIWAGGSEALLSDEGVLRGEWGFRGAVLTDYCDHHEFMNGDHRFRAGGDLWMSGVYIPPFVGSPAELEYETESNTFDQRLRAAVKNNTFMYLSAQYANSVYNASDDVVPIIQGTKTEVFPWWIPILVVLDVIVVAGCGTWLFFTFRKKKEQAA